MIMEVKQPVRSVREGNGVVKAPIHGLPQLYFLNELRPLTAMGWAFRCCWVACASGLPGQPFKFGHQPGQHVEPIVPKTRLGYIDAHLTQEHIGPI